MSSLALRGGEKSIKEKIGNLFKWPIVNEQMEQTIVDVLRNCAMSGTDITKEFEKNYAEWNGVNYSLGFNTGTASLQTAMYAVGVGVGDEVIAPSITYWATCLQALSLGASIRFADIDPETLCIDPADIERKINNRTKAIMVVHYLGHPADMDAIMAIAKKHNLKVVEDVSHAQGSLYKGRMTGTFGDAAGVSLMTGKSFAIGEAGIMLTNQREVYEKAILFGHYARHGEIEIPELKEFSGLPWGGYKYRMHQMSAAVGLEQLKKFPTESAEIEDAMNYFWDLVKNVPGVKAHRPSANSGSTMGGWYINHAHYKPEELGGLSVTRLCDALEAEGWTTTPGANPPLHLHPIFTKVDIYGHGKPTQFAHIPASEFDNGTVPSLPVSEALKNRCFRVPWFKHFRKNIIQEYADGLIKVVENYQELLDDDTKREVDTGWGLSPRKG